MKKWLIIIVAALAAAWLAVEMVRDISEAIRYFSFRPHELVYVAAISMLGGLAAQWYDRLSPRTQRQIRVFAWGAAASSLTACVGDSAFRLATLSSLVVTSGGTDWIFWMWLTNLFLGAIAVYLWFEFYRTLKSGASR